MRIAVILYVGLSVSAYSFANICVYTFMVRSILTGVQVGLVGNEAYSSKFHAFHWQL